MAVQGNLCTALVTLALLTGCASPPDVTLPTAPSTTTSTSDTSGAVEKFLPPVDQPMQAGWYRHARTLGESGPAVLLGHVDGNKQPGIFFRLKELGEGDEVEVSRKDGTTARFRVHRTEQIAKNSFPAEAVYGDTNEAELRLITCGGSFDQASRSYLDNIIVYATLI